MNVERIRAVADALRAMSIPKLAFGMNAFGSPFETVTVAELPAENLRALKADGDSCGTVACVAGWTMALFNPEFFHRHVAEGEEIPDMGLGAMALLELSPAQARDLFYAVYHEDGERWSGDLNRISVETAIRVLDHLAETGEVDWGRFLSDHEKGAA